MQLAEHYMLLYSRLAPPLIREPMESSIEEIAYILCCSTRHAKSIIKQMAELLWIEWVPGGGRGRKSTVVFLISKEQLFQSIGLEKIKQGDLNWPFSQLKYVDSTARAEFIQQLSHHFGFSEEGDHQSLKEVLRLPTPGEVPKLDPMDSNDGGQIQLVRQVFDSLIGFDAKTQTFVPSLAHYWEVDDTQCKWTFYLRKKVFFHNGKECTAQDVVFTLNRFLSDYRSSIFSYILNSIHEIRIVRDYILEIHLYEPNYLILHWLSSFHASILPDQLAMKELNEFFRLPIGTGPFQFRRNDRRMIELEAFDLYFDKRPHLDRIEMWIFPDHYLLDTGPLMSSISDSVVWKETSSLEFGSKYLAFNLNKSGYSSNGRFREAFACCLHRQELVDSFKEPRTVARSFIPGGRKGNSHSYNPDYSRMLLNSIGYDGSPILLYTINKSNWEKEALWIQSQAKQVGIQVELVFLPFEEILRPEYKKDADLVLGGEIYVENLEHEILISLLSDSSTVSFFMDKEHHRFTQEMIKKIFQEPTRTRRLVQFRKLESNLLDNHVLVLLYHYPKAILFHPLLQGLSLDSMIQFKHLWFKRKSLDLR